MSMEKRTTEGINTALERFYEKLARILIKNSAKAHVLGDVRAHRLIGQAFDSGMVQEEALRYAATYGDLLVKEGATMIKGKAVPWFGDYRTETRQKLFEIIEKGLKEGKPTGVKKAYEGSIAKEIKDLIGSEKDSRAVRIARTEIAQIQRHASAERYLASGVVQEEEWLCGPNPCPECAALRGKRFPVGQAPEVIHPNCTCDTRPIITSK